MTTIGITGDRSRTRTKTAESGSIALRVLLWFGVLSSLLYVATDLLGGKRYDGQSFTSQAISELGAIGAPTKSFVDPLFRLYNLLALAFGVGVYRAAAANPRLRIAAAALIGYGAIGIIAGFVGSFFAMHQRGYGSLASDIPHIILTAGLVVCLLFAMGFGAFALGKRFRVYSLATIATVIILGGLTAQYALRVAAGQLTPGMGIVERIDVYTALLWIAVLANALMKMKEPENNSRALPQARRIVS